MSQPLQAIRILLVDDHLLIRQGLRMLLEGAGGLQVVGEAARSDEALAALGTLRPDIVLLDLDLGGEDGLDCIAELTATRPGCRVIVLTGLRDAAVHQRAIRLGAAGIVLKEQAGELLIKAIRCVHDGEIWVDRKLTAAILGDLRRDAAVSQQRGDEAARLSELTPREREIVLLVTQGLPTTTVGQRLGISEKTVRNHLTMVYDKLQVHDRLALALYANRLGLTSPAK